MFKNVVRSKWFGPTAAIFVALLILPLFAPRFFVYIFALIYVTALLAMSLNMVVGYGGLFQFHHGVFYGVGAYTIALMLTKTSLPMWIGFIAGPIVASITGLIIGWFCVRLTRLYFGMLQISLGSLIWAIVFRWYKFTGGDDGIHGIPMPSLISSLNRSISASSILGDAASAAKRAAGGPPLRDVNKVFITPEPLNLPGGAGTAPAQAEPW